LKDSGLKAGDSLFVQPGLLTYTCKRLR